MANVNLQDRRLNRRLTQILSDLGQRPTASIPAACGGYAETTAAYRFFDNDKVTWQRVLQPHYDCTRRRAAQHEVVLLVQDTTELDLTRPQQQVRGAGPLDGSTRRGVFLHPLPAFTPDGLPLGAVGVDIGSRQPDHATRRQKKQRRRQAPLRAKESYRWLQGLRQARAVAQELPHTTCVCVADSEADVYELFAEPPGPRPVQWLIRSGYPDRGTVPPPPGAAPPEPAAARQGPALRQLRQQVLAGAVLFTQEISGAAGAPKSVATSGRGGSRGKAGRPGSRCVPRR
jgi:hypothetical protein